MSKHIEFPEYTPKGLATYDAAYDALSPSATISRGDLRRALSACLLEAMKQARVSLAHRPYMSDIVTLFAIADNLHSPPPPPPPPPTLAQARAADLDTPEGKAAVRDFLATLGEGEQL